MSTSSGIQGLIDFWKDFEFTSGDRHVHSKDDKDWDFRKNTVALPLYSEASPVERFLQSPHPSETKLHLSLTPVPYVGNLRTADIFLLMINPTVGHADYGTNACQSFQDALARNRKQEFDGHRPCFALDPQYWWSSWFIYYNGLFSKAVRAFVEQDDSRSRNYLSVLEELSQRLAIVELIPYYPLKAPQSKKFRESLPSVRVAKAAADDLAKSAEDGSATVMVRWTHDGWGLGDRKNIIHIKARSGLGAAQSTILKCLADGKAK